MALLKYIFAFLIFPGFLFSSLAGLFVGWIDRKVTARIQWRKGPPWYQNYLDIAKLFYKETIVPENISKSVFIGMPLLALAGASLVSAIVLTINAQPQKAFLGDTIVVIYLLIIPVIALMLGAFASGNPLASLGASREMKLMLAYELPFIMAIAVPVMKSGYVIKLGDILIFQRLNGPIIASLSGSISFIVMLLCVQAKLGLVPFDIAEAETEIISGPYIEYSGKALAIFKLARAVLLFVVPIFLMELFLGGIELRRMGLIRGIFQYALILVIIVVIKNTNPRVRVDQAVGFFWRTVTTLAVVSIVFAYFGK